jgi:ribosomal-protein-alanine N-acetyltransferase
MPFAAAAADSPSAAQELYRRFGFESAGVRVRYYENTEDALVMWCHDIQSPEFATRLGEFCPEAVR